MADISYFKPGKYDCPRVLICARPALAGIDLTCYLFKIKLHKIPH